MDVDLTIYDLLKQLKFEIYSIRKDLERSKYDLQITNENNKYTRDTIIYIKKELDRIKDEYNSIE